VDTTTIPEAPRGDTREVRALRLYRERRQDIVLIGRDTYEVPSQDGTRVYEVVYGGEVETCACPDFVYRNLSCVHQLAVGACRAKRRGQSARHLPDHERIRLEAAAHPERTLAEHVAAAMAIAGRTYVEDLRRISPAANVALSLELQDEERGL
jgi:hypothetical protein